MVGYHRPGLFAKAAPSCCATTARPGKASRSSASIGEAGDYWGTMLRYANEFNGVRVAAGIGYENITDRQTSAAQIACASTDRGLACVPSAGAGPADLAVPHPEVRLGVARCRSCMCRPACSPRATTWRPTSAARARAVVSGYWGQTTDCRKDANQWLIQAGIAKNWTGLGNTAFYGEYSHSNDWGASSWRWPDLQHCGDPWRHGRHGRDRHRADCVGPGRHPEHRCGCDRAVSRLAPLLRRRHRRGGLRRWRHHQLSIDDGNFVIGGARIKF